MISCRTLGPLEVQVDGRDPPSELTRKALALLVYLAFAPRHTRSKRELMSVFWPDAEDPAAALNQHTYLLRQWAGAAIAEEGDQLRLESTTVELDATRFERLRAEGLWGEAAALVRGPFLDGLAPRGAGEGFEVWLEGRRAHWDSKCAEVLIRQAEALLAGAAPEHAVPVAERALDLMPRSDLAVRTYLRALALSGHRAEALDAFQRFAKRLAADLGEKAEPETIRLVDRIRLIKPRPRPAEKGWGRRRGPMVGRSAPFARLLDVWARSRSGEAAVSLVLGVPGTGKTRFVEEIVERARLDGAAIAISRFVPGDVAHPWAGLITLAEGGLLGAQGIAAAPPPALATFAGQSSLWAGRFPAKEGAATQSLPRAFAEMIRAVEAEAPVLLVVEDAQWMDDESLHALLGILRDLAANRVTVLITAYPDPPRPELDQVRERIGRDLKGVVVTLEGLTHPDLVDLARWALPEYDAEQLDRVARRVYADSAGVPLIAFEILTAVAEGMRLGRVTHPWPPAKRTLLDALPTDLPETLVGAITVGFRRLDRDAQAMLAALAVLGDRSRGDRLGRAAALPEERVAKALDDLEWRRWVVADSRGYSFVARAVGGVVKDRLTGQGERQRILAQAAPA